MAAIITEKFRLNNAKQFVEDMGEAASSAYMFIGRSYSWTDDSTPPTPVDSPNDEFDAYRNMVAMKKISSTDISHAIVRRDWTSGTAYDEYRHNYTSSNTSANSKTTLWDSYFYVVTDDYNVYKCISNNSGGNSTQKPDHTTLATPTESDSYKWKFMYSISASDVIKFVTNDFIPVKTLGAQAAVDGNTGIGSTASDDGSAQWDTENGATAGSIDHVRVVAGGSGYTASQSNTDKVIRGDGAGDGRCTVTTNGSGVVSAVTVTTVGTGYTYAYVANDDIAGFTNADQRADGTNVSANIEFIIGPKDGHGADAVSELGGNYVILNSRLEFAEGAGDFPTDNDFRQIGLVVNPTNYGGTTVATATTRTMVNKMTFSASGFSAPTVDTVLRNIATETNASAVGVVISVDTTNRIISYLPYPNEAGGFYTFSTSQTVFSSTSTNHGTISSLTNPEVKRHSGEVIYLENRGAVSRASDQIEDIKLIVEM